MLREECHLEHFAQHKVVGSSVITPDLAGAGATADTIGIGNRHDTFHYDEAAVVLQLKIVANLLKDLPVLVRPRAVVHLPGQGRIPRQIPNAPTAATKPKR